MREYKETSRNDRQKNQEDNYTLFTCCNDYTTLITLIDMLENTGIFS